MQTIYKFSWSFLLLCISGCWSYNPGGNISNPPVVQDLTRTKVKAANLSQTEDIEQRWQDSLSKELQQNNILYNFQSEKSKKLRLTINSQNLEQLLSQKVSLDLLLNLAYERNLGLKNAENKWQATTQRYPQAHFLQNQLLQYSSFTRTLNTKIGPQQHRPQVRPIPGKNAIMSEIVNTEIEIARQRYIISLRNLVVQVSKIYFSLVYSQEALRIQKQHLEILEALEKTARDKFRAGLTKYGDVLKLQIIKEAQKETIKTCQEHLNTVQVQLLATLNLPVRIKLGDIENRTISRWKISIENLYKAALEKRQEIIIAKLENKKLQQLVSFAKDGLHPDFTVGLSYFQNRTQERTSQNISSFPEKIQQMPRFDFGQRESYIQEMVMQQQASQQHLHDLEQGTIFALKNTYLQTDEAWRQFQLHKNRLIPLTSETIKVIRVQYQTGKNADFLDVLDTERSLLNLSLMLEKYKRDYLWGVLEIEKIVGESF